MDNVKDGKLKVIERLYIENADSYRYFLDWRHKVILRYVLSFVTAVLLAKVILDNKEIVPEIFLFTPALLISISSLVAYGMDRRNGIMTHKATEIGMDLEKELLSLADFCEERCEKGAFYTKQMERINIKMTYTNILKYLYISTATIFFLVFLVGTFTILE